MKIDWSAQTRVWLWLGCALLAVGVVQWAVGDTAANSVLGACALIGVATERYERLKVTP